MTIRLNGNPHETSGSTRHIGDLLKELQFEGQPVLVEYNGNALFPRDFETTAIKPDDQIELIRVVAGG